MRRLDEIRTATISATADRTVEGQMRVRGIDVRSGDRGFVFEQREPVALLIREQGSLRRVALPPPRQSVVPYWVAAPIAALVIRRLLARRRF